MKNIFLEQHIKRLKNKRILIVPLDWGIGHATRCVPIIKLLLSNQNEVIIASSGEALAFLQREFPKQTFLKWNSYNIRYSSSKTQIWAMLSQSPKILWNIYKEHKKLKTIIKRGKIDVIISDNRFGLWNSSVESIYITHQIMIKMPLQLKFFEPLLYSLHKRIIEKYDHCWIPDLEGENNLSGDLSHKYPLPKNSVFIGFLSRFEKKEFTQKSPFQNLILISGPEPQRTIFEKEMIEKFKSEQEETIIILGKPTNKDSQKIGNITIKSHLKSDDLAFLIQTTPNIFCRSGYSTLMDLSVFGKKATLVPTPGQTEQEYLAERLKTIWQA